MASKVLVKYVSLDPRTEPDPVLLVQLSPGRCLPLEDYCRQQGVEPIDLVPLQFDRDRYVAIFRRARDAI